MGQVLPVEAIQERDIDLILLEEFITENSFCEWFVEQLDAPTFNSLNGAWKSISDFGFGETDILFSYNSGNRKIFLLIENKLNASFQNEQYDRYLKRAKEYQNKKDCDEVFYVLVAPELYCNNQNFFDCYITYEMIDKRFQLIDSKRSLFKSQLFQIAIEKLRRGYQPINSIPVQDFWHSYWRYREERYPNLLMKKPDIVPYKSDWPVMYDDNLKNIVFYHKLAQGFSDATFSNFSEEVEEKLKQNLPNWATYKRHNRSFSIIVFSGKVDRTKNFNEQIANIEAGLNNIRRLRDWIFENRHLLSDHINRL